METFSSQHLAAIFASRNNAEQAIADLESSGFSRQAVHLVAAEDNLRSEHADMPTSAAAVHGDISSGSFWGGMSSLEASMPALLGSIGLGRKEIAHYDSRIKDGEALVCLDGTASGGDVAVARMVLERNGGDVLPA